MDGRRLAGNDIPLVPRVRWKVRRRLFVCRSAPQIAIERKIDIASATTAEYECGPCNKHLSSSLLMAGSWLDALIRMPSMVVGMTERVLRQRNRTPTHEKETLPTFWKEHSSATKTIKAASHHVCPHRSSSIM